MWRTMQSIREQALHWLAASEAYRALSTRPWSTPGESGSAGVGVWARSGPHAAEENVCQSELRTFKRWYYRTKDVELKKKKKKKVPWSSKMRLKTIVLVSICPKQRHVKHSTPGAPWLVISGLFCSAGQTPQTQRVLTLCLSIVAFIIKASQSPNKITDSTSTMWQQVH